MTEQPPRIMECKVSGVAATDRNFFGGACQSYLLKHEKVDLRIDWSGGEDGTANVEVVLDAGEFDFPRVARRITEALAETYLAAPRVIPKHDLSSAA